MRRKAISVFLALMLGSPVFAQLSIEECYSKAQANYPLIRQYGLIEKTKEYNLQNAARGYLPQITVSAQATYQSDVTKLPFNAADLGLSGIEIPTVSQDQYKATLDVNQTIWDGGAIRSQRQTLRAEADVEQKNLDVSLYAVNERVNQVYFGILLADAQIRQNQLLQKELERNCHQVETYIDNGVANQSDLDAIRVELLKAKQSEVQLRHTRNAYLTMLGQLIGEKIDEGEELQKPEVLLPLSMDNNRPELALYDAQIRHLEAQQNRITAGLMPRLGLFVTGGYGKPGLNMLENSFKAYYLAGVKLTWNIGGFYTQRNDREKIRTNIRSVETQRDAFLFNTELEVTQRNAIIGKYRDQLKYDDEIIRLQRSVREASEVKMANGTLSGTELTRDIHAEQAAVLDKIFHEMQLLSEIYNLKYAINEL